MPIVNITGETSVAHPAVTTTETAVIVHRYCDQCGYSEDNQPIAKALFQVETERGSLYFCGHHFHVNAEKILTEGYPVRELN